MAGRKTSKTSKTDHVLNLLAGTTGQESTGKPSAPTVQEPHSESEATSPAAPAAGPDSLQAPDNPAAAVPRHRLTPPILEVARSNNEALSETIHNALEAALEEELAKEPPSPEPLSEPPTPIPPEVPAPSPAEPSSGQTSPEPDLVSPELPSTPEPAPKQPPEEDESSLSVLPDGSQFINVMELLVEEKLARYVRMFHLCECPRCLADAKALALTRLPAKYAVLSPAVRVPMLSFYQAKYDSAVTTQIIYACKEVMEHPRHTGV